MKEAVVFILDSSPSMNTPYPNADADPRVKAEKCLAENQIGGNDDVYKSATMLESNSTGTRLSCSKKALETMISDLMLKSVQNEVCVIVCKTARTAHHKLAATMDLEEEEEVQGDIPFPNLTELTAGVTRPTVDLLRRVWQIETVKSQEEAASLRGDIFDAIVLAADALYERTNNRKYQRKIVLFTDAEHEVVMDVQQLLIVVDSLRSMDCRLEVIGLDFEMSAEYDEPVSAESATGIKVEQQPGDSTEEKEEGSIDDSKDENNEIPSDNERDENDNEEIHHVVYSSKEDREELLLSLTEKTGGTVVAASTLQQLLEADKGKRIQTATKRKFELRIAPGLSVEARYLLMMSRASYPTLKKEAYMVDEEGRPRINALGQQMTDKITEIVSYIDPDNPNDVLDEQDKTTAIRYGSDLIAMNSFDYEGCNVGLKNENGSHLTTKSNNPNMEILGYVDRSQIPRTYLIGPPYAISGHDSQRACTVVAALAQALQRLNKAAICTFHKTKNSHEPVLGGLFPLQEEAFSNPVHLVFMQLPFAGDVKKLHMDSFEEHLATNNEGIGDDANKDQQGVKPKACDDLIDALMLPDNCLESGKVPSPFLRSWNQTKVKRAMDPKAEIVTVREAVAKQQQQQSDPMVTPPDVLHLAKPALEKFHALFELRKKQNETGKSGKTQGRKGRRILTYKDYL